MLQNSDNVFGQTRGAHKGRGNHPLSGKTIGERPATYSKVFRWLPSAEHAAPPKTVEIIGTFTNWERVALHQDKTTHAWQVTMHQIPSHKTHHYMLLVDGKPAQDKNSDGLAIPHGAQEEQFAISTPRGPRVFMLFAQTK